MFAENLKLGITHFQILKSCFSGPVCDITQVQIIIMRSEID